MWEMFFIEVQPAYISETSHR
ncbi:unnamed protein product [Staurois parvus]|uniref:Uncharacterized protein n=1 Tax=Staurois parvus TaxID=386267 RepID=A0ABN9G1I8_9NEOB|nr:unnamed protein product [Staurois parvus]